MHHSVMLHFLLAGLREARRTENKREQNCERRRFHFFSPFPGAVKRTGMIPRLLEICSVWRRMIVLSTLYLNSLLRPAVGSRQIALHGEDDAEFGFARDIFDLYSQKCTE